MKEKQVSTATYERPLYAVPNVPSSTRVLAEHLPVCAISWALLFRGMLFVHLCIGAFGVPLNPHPRPAQTSGAGRQQVDVVPAGPRSPSAQDIVGTQALLTSGACFLVAGPRQLLGARDPMSLPAHEHRQAERGAVWALHRIVCAIRGQPFSSSPLHVGIPGTTLEPSHGLNVQRRHHRVGGIHRQ